MKVRFFTIPNILTLANLFFGCLAILQIFVYDNLTMAFWMVVAAAVCDFADGFTARMLRSYSELGKQLDSLSDMVSFGVVPSFMLYSVYWTSGGKDWFGPGIYIVFLVALFSALRLAKFNIDESQKEDFHGLATPACAILIASSAALYQQGAIYINPLTVIVAAVTLSFLLISDIRMFSLKFKTFGFSGNELRYIFLILSVAALALFRLEAVPLIIVGYILTSTIRNMIRRLK